MVTSSDQLMHICCTYAPHHAVWTKMSMRAQRHGCHAHGLDIHSILSLLWWIFNIISIACSIYCLFTLLLCLLCIDEFCSGCDYTMNYELWLRPTVLPSVFLSTPICGHMVHPAGRIHLFMNCGHYQIVQYWYYGMDVKIIVILFDILVHAMWYSSISVTHAQ